MTSNVLKNTKKEKYLCLQTINMDLWKSKSHWNKYKKKFQHLENNKI